MSNAPFVTDPVRTAIAIAYHNLEYIADRALPRFSVSGREYKYSQYNKGDRFTVPDTTVGRKGRVNEVEFGATESTSQVKDWGLEDPIPQSDIDNAQNTDVDPLSDSTEMLTDLIMLDREIRVASVIHGKANFTTSDTISGTDQWTDPASDPITQITDALETPLMRPNVMTLSGAGALALRRNPAMIKAFNGTLGDSGLVPLEYIRQLFDLQEILIGRSKKNTSNKGQSMVLADVWGPHCALTYRNPNARPNKGVTFGWTAQYKSRIAGTQLDPNIGLEGGVRIRVGEMVDERIVASDVAHFLENVI